MDGCAFQTTLSRRDLVPLIDVGTLAIFFAIVLVVNLMPAFGPPTWSIIVFYAVKSDLPLYAIVLVGASAAASGRFLLAYSFRFLGNQVPVSIRENLAAARLLFLRKRRNAYLGLMLFALSPIPSAQLFEAAGLTKISLAHFTLAFFAGRLVSYGLYAGTAMQLKQTSLMEHFTQMFSEPAAIALEIAMIVSLVGFTKIPWKKILDRKESQQAV